MAAAGSPRLERWFRTPDGCFCGELFDKDGVPDGAVWKTSPCLALDAELLGYVTTRSSNEVFQLGERGRTIEVEFLGAQCPRGEWRYSINVFVDGVCSPIWRTRLDWLEFHNTLRPKFDLPVEPTEQYCMPGSAFFDNLLCTTPAPDRLLTVDQASNERIQSYFDGILNDPLFRQEPIFARFFGLAEHVARSLRPGRASASEQGAMRPLD